MPGYRAGWVAVTGPLAATQAYREGLELLASLRLCPNVPAQHAIQTCLGGYQSIEALIRPGGRLREQRDRAHKLLTAIPGVTCVPAAAAMYLFPRLDPELYPFKSDEQFVLDLLREQKILVSHGSAFNWPRPDHFRFVILPSVEDIEEAVRRISTFLASYRARAA
jgi:alanine-synthesizing transaminase